MSPIPPPMRYVLALAVVLLPILGGIAHAQSVHTLLPTQFEVPAGGYVDVQFLREEEGQRTIEAWPADRVRWLFVRVAGTQRNFEAYAPPRPNLPYVRIPVPDAGVALVGLDLQPRLERITAPRLREFLGAHLAPDPRWTPDPRPTAQPAQPAQPAAPSPRELRVRRIESIKVLVRVTDERGWLASSADAQGKAGQRVEIRPLADPTAVRVDRDLPVRVYLPSGWQRETRVIARHLPSGRTQSFLVDEEGTGHFRVDAPGTWTVEAHAARALADDPEADWEIHSATLSFEVPNVPDTERRESKRVVR